MYAAPLSAFQAQVDNAQPPLERLYGAPLAAVGYRNHPLQSHVETTYGYNPLELASYADYTRAAQDNPRLIAGLAATHRLNEGNLTILPNPNTLPLAIFARTITTTPDSETARERLMDLDPATETLVVGPLAQVHADLAATASVVERGDDHLTIHVRSASANLLRVAIPAFPGWHAWLNGVELNILSADVAFQGIALPAGEGDLRLEYTPRYFWIGALVSGLAWLTCLAVLARTH